MAYKYDLPSSELLLNEAFTTNVHVDYINKYVTNMLDTEDFSGFSKYTKNIVIGYFRAFLNRMVSQIWLHFANSSSNPESFFKFMVLPMSQQLTRAKQALLVKQNLSDSMSDNVISNILEQFFDEYANRAEFTKTQDEYMELKQDFITIRELSKSLYSCGSEMVDKAEYLLSTYLRYKEAILKGMGYDVFLDYQGIDNFDFIYRDVRLTDPNELYSCEQIAMNAALKATMPGFSGDIGFFKQMVTSESK